MNYLLPEEGLCLALAVRLDAANVVGRGALQDLQKLLQGGLQRGERGQAEVGAAGGIIWALVRGCITHPQPQDQDLHMPWDSYWRRLLCPSPPIP